MEMYILGIESSCDETAASIYDIKSKKIISNTVFSQIDLHKKYGGVVPEIASRSHLEKIGLIVKDALADANISISEIDSIAVTNKPGLAGALLIGLCFSKGLACVHNKKLISVDHIEAHIFSSFLLDDGLIRDDIPFPHFSLVASGGHTSLFSVKNFGDCELLGQTLDDAAGEAFDKVAKLIGLGYPGGPQIEKLANEVGFVDFFSYPRAKKMAKSLNFSFSGLKTAVLYDLINRGAYDLKSGIVKNNMTLELQKQVSSSLLVSISDIFISKLDLALKKHPDVKAITFSGGVACNNFLRDRLREFCDRTKKILVIPHKKYCGDNAAMVGFVGAYKYAQKKFADLSLDLYE
jgi:N6-L-threonylcarbamoyladenine synthase